MGCGHSVLFAKLAFQTTYHFINNDELVGSLSMDRTANGSYSWHHNICKFVKHPNNTNEHNNFYGRIDWYTTFVLGLDD